MSNSDMRLKATATVKLTKLDKDGNVVGFEERVIDLTDEEAKAIWHSQTQE